MAGRHEGLGIGGRYSIMMPLSINHVTPILSGTHPSPSPASKFPEELQDAAAVLLAKENGRRMGRKKSFRKTCEILCHLLERGLLCR
ncbi:hypothetical protein AVEN_26271-1 [Araneus ventricosus]|uniref:Uncharacterized protein n=1 Tax=Araneus ventricosus TaxID=182803 RepID=A0A4Y2AM51_ARAVE|nr:hypothetical protein AVEN_26271-1 [Araneus ventricosus]